MMRLLLGALLLAGCSGATETWDVDRFPDAYGPVCHCSVCNPLTQGGCNPGEKCTWVNDQDSPPIGHIGCAPDYGAAAVAIGGACTDPPAGPMGYDTCVKGAVCVSGE
jgi:hypothetical protein